MLSFVFREKHVEFPETIEIIFGGSKPPPYEFAVSHNHARRAVPWCRRLFCGRTLFAPTHEDFKFLCRGDHWSPVFVLCGFDRAIRESPLRHSVGYNHTRRAVPWCRRLFCGRTLFAPTHEDFKFLRRGAVSAPACFSDL